MTAFNVFQCFVGFDHPERIAVRTPHGALLRYRDLDALSAKMAGVLCDRGVRPGDRVIVQADKTLQAFALYLACLRFGAVYVPLTIACTAQEVSHIADECAPAVLVYSDGLSAGLLDINGPEVLTLNKSGGTLMHAASETTPMQPVYGAGESDLAAILYTPGTAGKLKGVSLTHRNLASNAQTLAQSWRFSEKDVLLHALPLSDAQGLFVAANVALAAGAQQVLLDKFDPDEVVQAMPGATVFIAPPAYYSRLLETAAFTAHVGQKMRLFVSGLAPLLPSTFAAFEGRTGQHILEYYGTTETAVIASNLYDGPRVPGSVGAALKNVSIRIVDANGALLPAGDTGFVEVKGPHGIKGYWQAPRQTQEALTTDGYFKTGDQGYLDRAGYLYLAGRASDMIVTADETIHPVEIEGVLNAREEVLETAVIGVPSVDGSETVVAIVVLRSGYEMNAHSMRAALLQKLGNGKVPKVFQERADLPRNSMGKVRKAVLREEYAKLFV